MIHHVGPGLDAVPSAAAANLPIFRSRDNSSPNTVNVRGMHHRIDFEY
jgi:hypothetical protein